jgi:Domain of unknown function (DUF1814).
MLYRETIRPATLDTLKKLQRLQEFAALRLVGGTSLALQFGHRVSIDLDLFGTWDKSIDLNALLSSFGTVAEKHHTENIRVFDIDGLKVDFVYYTFNWLVSAIEEDGIRLAAAQDIAPMKLEAAVKRGAKKDFIDIAELLERHTLADMLRWHAEKYPSGSEYLVLRSLTYFDDAEDEPSPQMLRKLTWSDAKKRIIEAVGKHSKR